MKDFVKEQLAERGLSYLWNEADFKTYYRKCTRPRSGGNKTLIALGVIDLMIFNGQPRIEP